MERRENQRVLLTKRLLKEALLQLLEHKRLEEINISELCRAADINRATFYKHYAIPKDVLMEIERDIANALRKMAPKNQTEESARQFLEDICVYLHDRRGLLRVLLSSKTDEDLLEIISQSNRRFWSQFGETGVRDLDEGAVQLMVTFFSSGAYYLIRQWLLDGVDKTPQEVADLIFRFVRR